MSFGACYPLHPLLSRAVASRGDGSILFDEVIIGSRRTLHKFVGVAEHRPVRMWMRCRNLDKRKDALVEEVNKMWNAGIGKSKFRISSDL